MRGAQTDTPHFGVARNLEIPDRASAYPWIKIPTPSQNPPQVEYHPRLTQDEREEVIDMILHTDLTLLEIATELGFGKSQVGTVHKSLPVEQRRLPASRSKIPEADIRAMRAAHAGGMGHKTIARRFGLHHRTVFNIVHGKLHGKVA